VWGELSASRPPPRTSQGVDPKLCEAGTASKDAVVGGLDPGLADVIPVPVTAALHLVGGDGSNVAEQLRGHRPARVAAQV
jgi:hypothetical protein